MADIRKALTQYLEGKSDVTDLVSTRIRPMVGVQGETEPYIVLRIIGGESDQHLTGGCGSAETRIQVDCFADDPTEAYAVREAVRANIPPSTPTSWGSGDDAVSVRDVAHENFGERTEQPVPGSGEFRFVAHLDLFVSHDEAVPT